MEWLVLEKPPWELLIPWLQPLLWLPDTPALCDALQPLVVDALPPTDWDVPSLTPTLALWDAAAPWLTATPALCEALLAVLSAPPQLWLPDTPTPVSNPPPILPPGMAPVDRLPETLAPTLALAPNVLEEESVCAVDWLTLADADWFTPMLSL